MLQTLWIRAKQDFNQVLKLKSRSSSYLKHRSEQGKISTKYSIKDLDQAASSGINQSQVIFNPSIQIKIEIGQRAQAWIRARPKLARVLKSESRSSSSSQLNQSRTKASQGTQRWIRGTLRWIKVN